MKISTRKKSPSLLRVAKISIKRGVNPRQVISRALRLSEEPRAKSTWEKIKALEKLERDLSITLKVLEPEFKGTNEYASLKQKRERIVGKYLNLIIDLEKLRKNQNNRKTNSTKKP